MQLVPTFWKNLLPHLQSRTECPVRNTTSFLPRTLVAAKLTCWVQS
jgi:hypothetical protein